MKHWRCYIVYITSIFLVPLDSYKILVFNPRYGTSHVRFVGKIADTLIEAGHNVTQLGPLYNPLIDTTGSKLAKTITINPDLEMFKGFNHEEFVQDAWKQKQQSFLGVVSIFKQWSNMFVVFCEVVLEHKEIMQELKEAKFDLAITEFDPCSLGMMELFEIPAHIIVSASGMLEPLAELVGMPNVPSYVPSMLTSYTDEMTYFQRAMNLLFIIFSKIWLEGLIAREQQLFHKLYDRHIDLKERFAQATYVLTNSDPFFDFPKPTIHKVKELGGVSVPQPEPLNEYWTAVMNRRKTVVLVSFGSVALSYLMPNETKQSLLETFDEFPDVTFIWKYEKEEHRIADGHPNVVTGKWVPQTDLLAHPNLVAFMTHGGMNSIMETLNRGKPVIVVPLFADQMQNAVVAQRSGFGTMLAVSELAVKEEVRDAFDRIIHDKSYARKAERLSKMIARRPNPSKEQLIRHVEFAAEFGQIPNFDPYGRKMSFISYYMLDIIIPFAILVLLIAVGLCYIVFRLFRRLILGIVSSKSPRNEEKEAKKNK